MNEAFFYIGIVLAIVSFIASIILFFTEKIPEVIRYYRKAGSMKPVKVAKAGRPSITEAQSSASEGRNTVLLENNETVILDIAQNYATVLLDAESDKNFSLAEEAPDKTKIK